MDADSMDTDISARINRWADIYEAEVLYVENNPLATIRHMHTLQAAHDLAEALARLMELVGQPVRARRLPGIMLSLRAVQAERRQRLAQYAWGLDLAHSRGEMAEDHDRARRRRLADCARTLRKAAREAAPDARKRLQELEAEATKLRAALDLMEIL